MFILRVGREDEQIAATSVTLMTKLTGAQQLGDHICKVRVIHVGGTLEKVEKALKKMTECWLEAQALKKQKLAS